MIALLAAFQFLTILPPIVRRPFSPGEMGRSVGFYPFVGLALGGALVGLDAGLRWLFPPGVAAALVLAAWVVLTRALHLDGFLDTCDGLFGGFTPEKRLAIMRDSRVGAFGAIGGVLLLLTKYAAIAALGDRAAGLLLAPTLARWMAALAIVAFPYARPEGMGRAIKDNARWPQAALATATAWLAAGLPGVVALALAGIALLIGAFLALRLLPGLTGDLYGAGVEMGELLVLLFFTVGRLQWAS
jgi:adenosylcobinamide-GDP ribazoletransferase